MSIGEGIRWRYGLVSCFLLFFIALVTESWSLCLITLGIILIGTADLWIWWIPGMSRRDKAVIPLKGAAERKLRTEHPDQWLWQCIRSFRSLGFFAAESDDEIMRRLDGFDATDPQAEFKVLKADANRVWILEGNATSDTKIYASVLEGWGRISRGSFSPTDISELWEDDHGPIVVEFTHDRRRHLLQPEALEGDIDLGILETLNELIEPFRFAKVCSGDELAVVCVTTDEQRLIRERGLRIT